MKNEEEEERKEETIYIHQNLHNVPYLEKDKLIIDEKSFPSPSIMRWNIYI
mgnify:FL=1